MSKTIIAKFDSIDAATIAASNAKDRCDNISSVKVKYKAKKDNDRYDPYVFPSAFAPVDASAPSVLQNGIFPVAVNVDPLADYTNHYPNRHKKATVEITASGGNIDPICATLRQGGGLALKVR